MKEKSVLILHDGIKVRRSVKHGYGVFTDIEIIADTIIEECMVPMQVIEHGVEIIDGKEFATKCLHEAGVAIVPGIAFGKKAIDYVRFSFAASQDNISQALENIKKIVG